MDKETETGSLSGESEARIKIDRVRDSNHTARYNILVTKRLYREHVRGEGSNILAALSDATNSVMRVALGFGVILFTIAANLCSQTKKKCYRKELR